MKTTVIYGSPRKGSSYKAAQIFKDEMQKSGEVEFTEFFLPQDLPEFSSLDKQYWQDKNWFKTTPYKK